MLSGANSLNRQPKGQSGEDIQAVVDYLSGGLRCVNYVWDTTTLDWVAASAAGGDISGGGGTTSTTYQTNMDDTGTYLYVGEAAPGTADSAASWRIKRVSDTEVKFADGVATFTKVWNNRVGYSY